MVVAAVGVNSQAGIIFALLGATAEEEKATKKTGDKANTNQTTGGSQHNNVHVHDYILYIVHVHAVDARAQLFSYEYVI